MVSRVKRHADFLRYLCKCGPKQRKSCIKNASPDEIRSILDIALNTFKGNIRVSPKTVKKLKPYEKILKNIALRKAKGPHAEKKLLIQKGGAVPLLPILLSSVLPYVLSKLT